ncbi:MAG TPA: hypothetical protein VKF41_05680 [Bryobacteraceae bacterium]|nr:hypothetical protein [Bryobacteraceae bacterium]
MSNSRLLINAVVLTVLSAGIGPAATPGWTFMNPKLAAGEVEIHKACVMPSEAKLTKVGMKGQEGMSKESDTWSTALQATVESHLKTSGVEILPNGMAPEDLEKNDELQQLVLKLQAKYDSISTQLAKHPKDTRKARFTVGDEVAVLPCTANADTLVYVRGQGQVLTGGKKAFGILVAGASASTASLTLSLVDAKSGDVLAYMHLMNAEKFVNDSEKAYGSRLDKLFKQMKIGNTGQKKKGK